jgi:glycosyltransferase involved in cell wall biosynthesis
VSGWIKDAGLTGRVTLTGMLEGERKLAALRDAEMFVLPSYGENFGIVVVEAMACGLPVIISDRVNIWREIAAADAGLVVKCDVEEVARALEELLDNAEQGRAMGRKGRELVKDRYSWATTAQLLEQTYRDLLSERGLGKGPIVEAVPS